MNRRNVSKPQAQIVELLYKRNPSYKIEEEVHIEDSLRLDILLRNLGITIEYMGRQHYEFIGHFHKTQEGFEAAQERDRKKAKYCEDIGLTLIIISYEEKITEELIDKVLDEALNDRANHPDYDLEFDKEIGHKNVLLKNKIFRQTFNKGNEKWKKKNDLKKLKERLQLRLLKSQAIRAKK